jgi:adenosylcobinamide-GDP ribazoletransferase
MIKFINDFFNTVTFLTRLPLPVIYPARLRVSFFPLVGILLGLITYLLALTLQFFFPIKIAAVLILIIYIFFTGGLHLDGFGDFLDGFFANRAQKETIAIMHDSNTGIFAVVGLILLLLLKFLLFEQLILQGKLEILLIMPVLARFVLTLMVARAKVAAESIMAAALHKNFTAKELRLSLIITIIFLVIFVLTFSYFLIELFFLAVALSLSLLLVYLLEKWAVKKAGGITGDIYGTLVELSELLILFTALMT